MKRLKRIGMLPLVSFLVLTVWEGCVHVFDIDLYILPAPSNILQALFMNRDILRLHSMVTLQEAVISLLIATLPAIVIAIGIDLSLLFKHSIFPHLVVTQTVPVMALGPLFSIWLGFGMAPKILMVTFMCFFPVATAFYDALGKVDEHQISLLKSSGAKKWQIYVYVKIPAASTALLSGLKVAATYCIDGAIVGEWPSTPAGLGYYMARVKNGYILNKVFACVMVIIALSLLLHGAVVLLEAVLFPYARKKRGKAK